MLDRVFILQYSIVVQDTGSAELAKHVPERAAVSSLILCQVWEILKMLTWWLYVIVLLENNFKKDKTVSD